uniref:golgin A7 family, member Ba isoform X2 n=2 Tax=Doryrhamphus excisus TaxID=161450 RepID=UPI0025ADF793|nr:golgin A7 family, member Ba isoform X2 [Doryrhamphus excisus]
MFGCSFRQVFDVFESNGRPHGVHAAEEKTRETEKRAFGRARLTHQRTRGLVPLNMATEFHNLQELRHSASLANKVFIQRDYSEGTTCKFQIKFPTELESRIERTLFEDTVKTLNNYYAEAEKIGGQSYMEGCLACATAYLIFLCMETRYEKVLKKIAKYIQEQNEKIYAPRGLLITDPIERGMRVIEISIYEDRGSSGCSSGSSSVSSSTAR